MFQRLAFIVCALMTLLAIQANAQQNDDSKYWIKRGNEAKENNLKIVYYSAAIQREPQNAQAYVWRGMAKRGVGKYRESIADFDSAVFYRPNYDLALSFRGDSYLQLKDYEKAVTDFKATLRVNPTNDFALAHWAEIERLQNNPKQALAHLALANHYNAQNDYAWVRRAALHLEATRLDSAIYCASKAIEFNALNDWAWQIRGEAYRMRGNLTQAAQDLKTACDKNPFNLQSKVLLAKVYQLQKNEKAAMDLLYNVLEENPGHVEAKKAVLELEKRTSYRPLRPKPQPQTFRTGLDIIAKAPPPLEERPRMSILTTSNGMPRIVDHANDICAPRMQGRQNSCGGFALSYLASFHEKKETGKLSVFSPAFIYHLSNNGRDLGVKLDEALENWRVNGICHEYAMLYDDRDATSQPSPEAFQAAKKHRIQASFPLWTLEEVKYQLAIGNPVVISVLADESLWELKSSPWRQRYGKLNGAHAMLIIGYDDDKQAIKVINSWGKNWGDGGYGWISYNLFDEVRLRLFVTKDAINMEEQEIENDFKKYEIKPEPFSYDNPRPSYPFGMPMVTITGGGRNTMTGNLDVFGTSNVPPLSGYNAQIVVYYYDAMGNKIPSQQFPYTTYDGQASHGTAIANLPFLGLPNQSWWVNTPSFVFPFWHIQGAAIMAQPILFIDGFQVAIGPTVRL